jgi:hypothetical protein
VDLNFFFAADAFLGEELHNAASAVTLELNDGSPFIVLMKGSIAMPGLLERTKNFLQVQILR